MFVILYFTFIRESRTDRMLKKFPGPRDYPIVGHGHKLLRQEGRSQKLLVRSLKSILVFRLCEPISYLQLDNLEVINGWFKQYGKRLRVYFGSSQKVLMIIDPVDFEVIKDRKKAFSPENITNAVQTDEADEELSDFSTKKRFAFLDLLLHIQASGEHELTDKDIQDETDGFMFGGNDSVASAITWAIYLLGRHPLQQSKVHEELDSVFGDDKSASIESKDLRKLKYLEMCIKESMRLYPAIPLFSRSVLQDFELDTNSVVPKGAIIMFNLYSANRNAENFPDPEEYRPERFSAENCEKRNPYAFMPFSAGPRKCMGPRFVDAEEKTILANIFRNFQVTSLDSPENVKPVPQVVLKPKDGIRVKFDRR